MTLKTNSLEQQACLPCKGGTDPMDSKQAHNMMALVPGWELLSSATKLRRTFTFGDFMQAQAFAAKVGDISEEQGHHPDISYGWGYCTVVYYTHKIGGLHRNDFIMAARVNRLE